jgi:hypothetical protein
VSCGVEENKFFCSCRYKAYALNCFPVVFNRTAIEFKLQKISNLFLQHDIIMIRYIKRLEIFCQIVIR